MKVLKFFRFAIRASADDSIESVLLVGWSVVPLQTWSLTIFYFNLLHEVRAPSELEKDRAWFTKMNVQVLKIIALNHFLENKFLWTNILCIMEDIVKTYFH